MINLFGGFMENKRDENQVISHAKRNRLDEFLWISLIFIFSLFGWPRSSWTADFYIAQNQAGTNDGSSCANARAVDWFNTTTNWANPKQSGRIGPGDTVHLCGTIVGPAGAQNYLVFQGDGSAGNPITLKFEDGARMSAPYWNTAINFSSGSYIGGVTRSNNVVTVTTNNPTGVSAGDRKSVV
jgi:hypothetical protein